MKANGGRPGEKNNNRNLEITAQRTKAYYIKKKKQTKGNYAREALKSVLTIANKTSRFFFLVFGRDWENRAPLQQVSAFLCLLWMTLPAKNWSISPYLISKKVWAVCIGFMEEVLHYFGEKNLPAWKSPLRLFTLFPLLGSHRNRNFSSWSR